MILLTMEILRVAAFFLLLCCYSVFSFPSRPLNERSTELAWQAWLLVDDQQNQQKQMLLSENLPRRRITPKSVFIAPTFSPESLPACADGYRPDSMGRCIKIIKLDEEAHLEFLLEKLNAQFGNYDDMEEESQENAAASGPFQLNIPLNPQEAPSKELDVAILVTPAKGYFGEAKPTTVALGDPNVEKVSLPNEEIAHFAQNANNTKHTVDAEISTTEAVAILLNNSATPPGITETSTSSPSSASETTTLSFTEETTIADQNALFFLQPSLTNTDHVQNSIKNANDTPHITSDDNNNKLLLNNSVTTSPSFVIDASININNKLPFFITHSEPAESETNTNPTSSIVHFPTDAETTTTDYFKFPDQITKVRILPQLRPATSETLRPASSSGNTHQTLYHTVFKGYLNPNGSNNLKGNEHFVFKDVTNMPSSLASDPVNWNHNTHNNQPFNHRNRDKNTNLWSLTSSWSHSSPKPIVLRFSRRASNSRHLLPENSQTFYREVPSEDISYLFGRDTNTNYNQNKS